MKPETKDRMKRVLKTSKKLLDDTKDDVDEIKKRKRKIALESEGAQPYDCLVASTQIVA